MSELETRRVNLLRRIEHKRKEICCFLDNQFYNVARGILKIMRETDSAHNFEHNPSELPEYLAYVHHPMYWSLIDKKLTNYEYNTSAEFIVDMREVVNNCYEYNKHSSPFSAIARDLEVRMEDEFVRQLGLPPPDIKELIRLGSHLPRETSAEVWKVISRYEKMAERPQGTRVHVSPAKYACATQRRIIALLRQAALARAQHAASRASKANPSHNMNNAATEKVNSLSSSSPSSLLAAQLADANRMKPHSPIHKINDNMSTDNNSNKGKNITSSYQTGAILTRDMLAVPNTLSNLKNSVPDVRNSTIIANASTINHDSKSITTSTLHKHVIDNNTNEYNDDIEFHEEPTQLSFPNANTSATVEATSTAFTTTLERVPQNARSLTDDVRIVSPVNLEMYNSDDFGEEVN